MRSSKLRALSMKIRSAWPRFGVAPGSEDASRVGFDTLLVDTTLCRQELRKWTACPPGCTGRTTEVAVLCLPRSLGGEKYFCSHDMLRNLREITEARTGTSSVVVVPD